MVLRRLRRAAVFAGCAAAMFAALAQPKPENETQVKALLVLNFVNYVEWPAHTTQGELLICVVGLGDIDEALEQMRERSTSKRPIRIKSGVSLAKLAECSVAFITVAEERRVAAILAAVESAPVLTVSDIEGFVDNGGMLGIVNVGQRLGFDANAGAARRAGLQLSSKMLQLARRVIRRDAT